MQAHYPARIQREMGCTEAELRAWLPGASGGAALQAVGDSAVEWQLPGGRARIAWAVLPPRRIALMALPRLAVTFDAGEADPAAWQAFMRRFDLYTQRGGG